MSSRVQHISMPVPWRDQPWDELEGGLPAYQLLHLHVAGLDISDHMHERRGARRFDVTFDPRASIDAAFGDADHAEIEEGRRVGRGRDSS